MDLFSKLQKTPGNMFLIPLADILKLKKKRKKRQRNREIHGGVRAISLLLRQIISGTVSLL